MNIKGIYAAAAAFRAAVKSDVVSAEEIQRRLSICNTCPKRVAIKGVKSNASYILGMLANSHRVPKDIAGYACDVCGCSILLLAPATKKDLHTDSTEEAAKRPATCWLKEVEQ